MKKVVWRGSIAGVFLYASVGVFGYLTFYNRPSELMKQNILLADYNLNVAIILVNTLYINNFELGSNFYILFSVLCYAVTISSSKGNSRSPLAQRRKENDKIRKHLLHSAFSLHLLHLRNIRPFDWRCYGSCRLHNQSNGKCYLLKINPLRSVSSSQ